MSWTPPSKVGDSNAAIPAAKIILEARYSYAKGVNDGTPFYTTRFGEVLADFGRRVNLDIERGKRGGPRIPTPGVFDWATKVQLGLIVTAPPVTPAKPAVPWTNVHAVSAPGSGVPWDVGPPFELGELLKRDAGVHHWPLGYPIGGYLGFMGGDSADSYLDVLGFLDAENERRIRIDTLPQYGVKLASGQAVTADQAAKLPADFTIIGLSYSQSAEGMIRSFARLMGDGGVFELLRPRLAGIVAFGNPVRVGGVTAYGRTPANTGISDWRPPPWLARVVFDIVNESPSPDFYAANGSRIARLAYGVIVRAETELPFVLFLAKIVIPALLKLVAPFLGGGILGGGLSSILAIPILGGATGMSGTALTPLLGMAGQSVDPAADAIIEQILDMLTPLGLLSSLPDLIGLMVALPGIGTHGDYFAPKSEYGGRNGVQVGYDLMRAVVPAKGVR